MSEELDAARIALDDAITTYARAAGHGNEIVTSWLVTLAATASDLDDGDTAILIANPKHQGYITNLGLAVHTGRYFGPGDDE